MGSHCFYHQADRIHKDLCLVVGDRDFIRALGTHNPTSTTWQFVTYIVAPSVADPWHFGVDQDPDPSIFIIDLQDANKKQIFLTKVFLHINFL
jgi:hypothetical protein